MHESEALLVRELYFVVTDDVVVEDDGDEGGDGDGDEDDFVVGDGDEDDVVVGDGDEHVGSGQQTRGRSIFCR